MKEYGHALVTDIPAGKIVLFFKEKIRLFWMVLEISF